METPELSPPSEEYQPTSKQLRRDTDMRRFNRLFVFLPIAFVSGLVVLTILILSIYVLSSDPQDYVSGLSAIADSVVIIILIGLMIPMGLFIALVAAAFFQGRKAGMAPLRQTQRLFWRLDMLVGRFQRVVFNTVPRLADPFIIVHGRVAFWRVFIRNIKRMFNRG
jgi:hypothetical protein